MYHPKKSAIPLLLFLVVTIVLSSSACSKKADVIPDSQTQSELDSENAHTRFSALTEEIFLKEVTSDSITLHYTVASPQALSISQPSATLGHISEEVRLASIAESERCLKELKKISYDALPREDKITYDILKWEYETIASSKTFSYYSESISPTIGIQAQLPILLAEYEFRCSQDIEDYLLLLRQLPEYYSELLSYEQKKAQQGLFMADFALQKVIAQCKSFLTDSSSHYLTTTFNSRINALAWLTDEQKEQFKQLNLTTLSNYVYPAYQSLIDGLTPLEETCTNKEGLCHYPDGKSYYSYLVKKSTGSDRTPEELIKCVQKQLQTDLTSMSALLNDSPSTLENLQSLSISYTQPEEILKHLEKEMQAHFPTPPSVSYTIKYVDPSMEEHLSPAFYLTPPIDRITENVIYINQPSIRDNIQLFTTLAHEGYPGHLYQNIYSSAAAPNKIRSLFSFPGYAEGYATYAELYSYRYMGLDENLSSLLRLSSSVTLGLYASLDLGIHYDGWSPQQAKDFLYKYGIQNEETVTEIYETIVAEPANYLKYYVGYLEFLTLREKAEKEWRNDFSDKKFHQYILELGDAPFCVLEKYLNQ